MDMREVQVSAREYVTAHFISHAGSQADRLLYTEGNVKRHEEGPEEEENTTPCEPQARACGQRHQVGGKKGRRYGAREDEIVVVDVKAA